VPAVETAAVPVAIATATPSITTSIPKPPVPGTGVLDATKVPAADPAESGPMIPLYPLPAGADSKIEINVMARETTVPDSLLVSRTRAADAPDPLLAAGVRGCPKQGTAVSSISAAATHLNIFDMPSRTLGRHYNAMLSVIAAETKRPGARVRKTGP
jgi:hypothetical protein